jgi:CBS domain-containing protein
MSKSGHFPAFDFECEDEEDEAPTTARRKLRRRRIVGEATKDAESSVVECPFRDKWPSLEQCVACEKFKGYSLDPTCRDSYVTCAKHPEPASAPASLDRFERGRATRTKVSDVMSDPVCVQMDLGYDDLASLLTNLGIGGAVVVDDDGLPLGVVSKTDLVRERGTATADWAGPKQANRKTGPVTVGDIMSPGVYSLPASASLADAIDLMSQHGIHRVPVLTKSGHVVGIVSALDIARWLARPSCRSSRADDTRHTGAI